MARQLELSQSRQVPSHLVRLNGALPSHLTALAEPVTGSCGREPILVEAQVEPASAQLFQRMTCTKKRGSTNPAGIAAGLTAASRSRKQHPRAIPMNLDGTQMSKVTSTQGQQRLLCLALMAILTGVPTAVAHETTSLAILLRQLNQLDDPLCRAGPIRTAAHARIHGATDASGVPHKLLAC